MAGISSSSSPRPDAGGGGPRHSTFTRSGRWVPGPGEVFGPSNEALSKTMPSLGLPAAALLIMGVASTSAAVVVEYGPATEPFPHGQAVGQGVTTPAGGPWTGIQFSWIRSTDGSRLAEGSLFLLSSAYAGVPANLSSSTTGFLAVGTVSGGGVGTSYTFDPSVTLQSNTQYFFYSNNHPGGVGVVDIDTSGTYTGGSRYGSINGTGPFTVRPGTVSFVLEGVAAVPEPTETAAVSLGLALVGMVARRWKVRRLENRCHPIAEPRL